jgi:hypothetical protein
MIRQVVVESAWSDGPRSGEGERRERVRMIEGGDLGDHPADADAREVRRPFVELAGEGSGVGCKSRSVYAGRLGLTVVDAPESRRS